MSSISLSLFLQVRELERNVKRGQSRNENRNTGVRKVYELSFGVGEFSKHTLERGRQRGAIYLSCQQFSGKWGGAALDLMRRGSNSETTRTTTTTTTTTSTTSTTMPFEDRRTRGGSPSLGGCTRFLGSYVGSTLCSGGTANEISVPV